MTPEFFYYLIENQPKWALEAKTIRNNYKKNKAKNEKIRARINSTFKKSAAKMELKVDKSD